MVCGSPITRSETEPSRIRSPASSSVGETDSVEILRGAVMDMVFSPLTINGGVNANN